MLMHDMTQLIIEHFNIDLLNIFLFSDNYIHIRSSSPLSVQHLIILSDELFRLRQSGDGEYMEKNIKSEFVS